MKNRRIPTYLSRKDEYVPENYIPLNDLLSDGKYALYGYSSDGWCIGWKTLDKFRRRTFNNVMKHFEQSDADSFSRFWNGNLDSINDKGLNEFAKIPALSEICVAMIAFQKTIESKSTKIKRKYVSFGIKREIYERYAKSIEEAGINGEPPKKVDLYDIHKKRSSDFFQYKRTNIEFNGKWVELHKNELFLMFEKWCKLKRKTKKDALYEAMTLIMQQQPVEGLGDITDYQDKNRVLKPNCQEVGRLKDYVSVKLIYMPKELEDIVSGIISRFNDDPINKGKGTLDFTKYITQAVMEFNKKIPLKYIDPVAYEEYLKIKENIEYNG